MTDDTASLLLMMGRLRAIILAHENRLTKIERDLGWLNDDGK